LIVIQIDPGLRAKPYDVTNADTSPEAIAELRFGIPASKDDLAASDTILDNPSVKVASRRKV
jgi:hypothetical protein